MTSTEEFEVRRMAVADQVLAEPDLFDMNSFGYQTSCGTVACLAGTAVLQAQAQGRCVVNWASSAYADADHSAVMISLEIPGRGIVQIDDFARSYLGLPTDALFYKFSFTAEEAAKALLEAPYVP